MTSPIISGYLVRPYLSDPYLTNFVIDHLASQVTLVIQDTKNLATQTERLVKFQKPVAEEIDQKIAKIISIGSQTELSISKENNLATEIEQKIIDENHLGSQIDLKIEDQFNLATQVDLEIKNQGYLDTQIDRISSIRIPMGSQIDRKNIDGIEVSASQIDLEIKSSKNLGSQVDLEIKKLNLLASQIDISLVGYPESLATEIRRENYISHWACPELGYLADPYLSKPYLVAGYCAHVGAQVDLEIRSQEALGTQVDRSIRKVKFLGTEIERMIQDIKALGSQIERINAVSLGSQVRFVLYNAKKIRILLEFPSRGTMGSGTNAWGQAKGQGLNWLASSTLPGSFTVNNVNTDIVEQVWRSNNALAATVACDTEITQGVAPDTLAILNHNFSSSAVVIFEGSNDSSFSSIGDSIAINPTRINAYYVAPTLPTKQFRYWRLNVSDPTNPQGFLQIGTIIFGSSIIFQGEDIIDTVRRRTRHFSDKVATEGYTNVSNDRSIKRAITVTFSNLDYTRGNFENLISVFETARTSLKCLWMPDPQDPSRFTVFGKLTEIPEEEHRNLGPAADVVNLVVEIDESL